MFKRLTLTVLALGLIALGIGYFKQQQSDARARAMAGGAPPATVTATRVELTPWAARIEAVGGLTAIQDVAIASEVSGKVMEIAFASGAAVSAGDVLVRLDDSDDRALLQSLQAELDLARIELERVERVRGSAAFSQSQLDRSKSEVANLAAQVERQQVQVRKKTIRAPFDGVLGIRQVGLGTIVAPGETIVEMQSLSPIYVDFTVPERHRAQVHAGQPLELNVAAWPQTVFQGTLQVVSPKVDERTRTLRLRGVLDNADQRLQPGMFATVHLILGDPEPVPTLPRTAISFFAYGESVFVIDDAGDRMTVRRQAVQVGRTRGERVEILSGLEAGDLVVHTGHLKLRDRQAVVITEGVPLPDDVIDG